MLLVTVLPAMVRRSCFGRVGGFSANLSSASDYEMWTRLSTYYHFAVVEEPLTLWRQYSYAVAQNPNRLMADLRQAIEQNFQSIPLEFLPLRNQSYGFINMRQAWSSLDLGNLKQAKYFQRQAALHHPPIRYSKNYLHLSLIILMMNLLGDRNYEGLERKIRHLYRLMWRWSV